MRMMSKRKEEQRIEEFVKGIKRVMDIQGTLAYEEGSEDYEGLYFYYAPDDEVDKIEIKVKLSDLSVWCRQEGLEDWDLVDYVI